MTPSGPGRATAGGLVLAAALLLGLTACSGGSKGAASPTPSSSALPGDTHQSELDRAVDRINATRGPLVTAMNAIIDAANRVDAVDAASTSGSVPRVSTVRRGNAIDATTVDVLVARLPGLYRSYAAALDALSTAADARGLPVRLAAAVNSVVSAGRAEADADSVFVRAVAQAWPAYAVLAGQQLLWYERATGDWYSDTKQAADEYAVLTAPLRTTTTNASDQFGKSDSARRAAADQWAATLTEVHPILDPPSR